MNRLSKTFFIWGVVLLLSSSPAHPQSIDGVFAAELLSLSTMRAYYGSGDLVIHTIDVGQGASELVIGPNGMSILIDGGTSSKGSSEVLPYLNAIFPPGSRHLDYMIASHDDSDHYGGLDSVLSGGYTAGTIYHCGINSSFGKGVQIPLGLEIDLGDGAKATCMGRYGQFIDGSSGDTSSNNASVCLLIQYCGSYGSYGGFDYITAGDLESNENQLSNALITYPPGSPYLDPAYGVDVIHVNHHGSDGSSSANYVNRLKPGLAVINGGTNYGHPRWTAVDRLKGRTVYSDGSGATGVTWSGASQVYRTTYDIEEDGRAPEWDCPTLGDMVLAYDGCSCNYYLNGSPFPVDQQPICITPTPTPTMSPTPTPPPTPSPTSTVTPTPSTTPTPSVTPTPTVTPTGTPSPSPLPAFLGNYVWEDTDKDGIRDGDESGIAGITVELYLSDETFVSTTDTDVSGFYAFSDLNPAVYYVQFTDIPDGYYFTAQDRGGDDSLDSDADRLTGKTINITLSPGETDYDWDAGLYSTANRCFDVQRASLLSAQTDSTDLIETGLAVNFNLTTTGAVAVFSTFVSKSVSEACSGLWDLEMDDSWSSQTIERYHTGTADRGMGGAVHIFENLASGLHTVELRHATDSASKPVETFNADLVAYPLVSGSGEVVLNHGIDTIDSAGETTTYSALTDIKGLATTVTLDVNGRVFAAAAVDTQAAVGSPLVATYDIQVNGVTVGVPVQHHFNVSNHIKPIIVVGLSGTLSPGTYDVQVRHATSTGTIKSCNGTVLGIALNDDGGGSTKGIAAVQQAFTAETGTNFTTLTDIAWSRATMYLTADDRIFVASSFVSNKGSGGGTRRASYDIIVASDPASVTSEGEVDISDSDDVTAGGLFGLSDPVAEGSHTVSGRHATDDEGLEVLTDDMTTIGLGVCCDNSPTAVELIKFSATGYDSLVSVVWKTGVEIDTLGFYLLRADALEGPFVKLSDELIFAQGSGATGARYLFLDRLVENGAVYYYQLEEIETTENSNFYGPVEASPYRAAGPFTYHPADYAVVVGNGTSPSPTPPPAATPSPTPFLSPTPSSIPTATPTAIPTPQSLIPIIDYGDYSGDGTSDIAIFRPEEGLWSIRGLTRVYFGSSNDIPVSGDYDGDFTADIALFRLASGLWAIRGLTRVYYGGDGDIPAPADYDGDGLTDIAVFRPTSGLWAIRGITRVYFGSDSDRSLPSDYDGDGTADIAVFRGASGLWAIRFVSRFYYGGAGDTPVSADYDGDWTDEVAVFRPASGLWAIRNLTRVYFGRSTDRPVPGVYGGDGASDIAIFRPAFGLWAIRGLTRSYYGAVGDLPITR